MRAIRLHTTMRQVAQCEAEGVVPADEGCTGGYQTVEDRTYERESECSKIILEKQRNKNEWPC
eukprot:scaffold10861_cov180-Amphora_coffeaeformis.AAC.1